MASNSKLRPRMLIEDWLPVAELGIESRRERRVFTDLPPLSYLHVWWARRPIVASQAVVLAGLLPAWSVDVAQAMDEYGISTSDEYHKWFLRLVGIVGDPIQGSRREAGGVRGRSAFGYSQAWKNEPRGQDKKALEKLLTMTWGQWPTVADPTAGGGSIPFGAARYGLNVIANDLSGVATAILHGGVGIPALKDDIHERAAAWAEQLALRLDKETSQYFGASPAEVIVAYLYAYQVPCKVTGKPVPLLPNLWLDQSGDKAAVRVEVDDSGVSLQLCVGQEINFDPKVGTIKGGVAKSPYTETVLDSEYIKQCAQAGQMKPFMYAVATRSRGTGGRRHGRLSFRTPNQIDLECERLAAEYVDDNLEDWRALGLVPSEAFPDGNDMRPLQYGMESWAEFFTPRQLLVHALFVRAYRDLVEELQLADPDNAASILVLLTLMHGKMLDYNSKMSAWNVKQSSVQHGFESHNFAFKATFAEKMTAGDLVRWASAQVCKAARISASLQQESRIRQPHVMITQGSAASLPHVPDGTVEHVCIDPPYYDNVMYGELSDFFHVWHRRTIGRVMPELFPTDRADVNNEAVANVARFRDQGRRRRELADLDYESKMAAIFSECRRILRDDGVLTVMFTHKRAEAWDTLGMAMLQAGFSVETSWPVNTEFEFSTHQAGMNSAASTIMLACRKRPPRPEGKVFLDDIESDVRLAVRAAVRDYEKSGIAGVDLLLAAYGPALSVISRSWPVYSAQTDSDGRARLLRPEEALRLAREEVVRLQRMRIIGRESQFDDHSDFCMLMWAIFGGGEVLFDDARRLALTVGALDMDALAKAKILEKKSGSVRLLSPKERLRRRGDESTVGVRPEADRFEFMNDALDTVLYVAEIDGMGAAKAFMDKLGLHSDQRFLAFVQGMVNAVPRVKVKGEWVVPMAGLLDTLVTAHLPDITLPPEPEAPVEAEEMTLFS